MYLLHRTYHYISAIFILFSTLNLVQMGISLNILKTLFNGSTFSGPPFFHAGGCAKNIN